MLRLSFACLEEVVERTFFHALAICQEKRAGQSAYESIDPTNST